MEEPAKIVKTKLFIGNLDPATQTEELNELCAPFGTVLEASVIKDYGFVHYGSVEEAEKAAYALNNKEFHGKRLRVELSTSTVRHRPGQPEPASALRHSSRARGALKGANGNGTARYGADATGVGPVRHGSSAWARHEAHPYGGLPMPHGAYDRSRPYDMRPDAQRFFDDRRDNGYPPGYDASGYPGGDGDRARHYRDMPPLPPGEDYGRGRSYDRHLGAPPADPYYNSGLPHGPPPPMDPYPGYDPYQKYYGGRGRDSEYSGQRDYDPYSSYRNGSYSAGTGSGPARHDMPAGLQPPPPPPGAYSSSHRQPHSYGSAPTGVDPYYGARQR